MFRDLLLLGFRRPSLRKQPFLLAPRRWGRFVRKNVSRNVPNGEERGETAIVAG